MFNKFDRFGDWGLGIGPNPQSPIPNPQMKHIKSIKLIKHIKNILSMLLTFK